MTNRRHFLQLCAGHACMMPFALGAPLLRAADLPELGDPAERHLTPAEQARLGQAYYRRLIAHPDYLADPEWFSYLNSLGRHLAQYTGGSTAIEINLLGDKAINASALPGGYITVHAGLILACEREDELAAVLAHEIAHIHQRHLVRMIARLKGEAFKTAAALLASVIAGGPAGVSAGTLVSANLVSQQLAYTREFELEADALGIRYLADAGFAPQAMSAFLTKLEQDSRTRSKQQHEFLRTHPLSYQRIANAEERARNLPKHSPEPRPHFALLQTKLEVQVAERADLPRLDSLLAERAESPDPLTRLAADYGRAKVAGREHRTEDAVQRLKSLVTEHPTLPALSLALAEAEQPGDPAAAAARLAALALRHPDTDYLLPYRARALLAAGDAAAARAQLRRQLRRTPKALALYPLLAKAEAALGNLGAAHQAEAEYRFRLGDYPAARDALKRALRDAPQDHRLQQSARARLSEIDVLERAL